ncbi:MAG TPA: hypothetical protein VK747_07530 [Blastocatellia bacterium]|nr:hypothetical protein [Blastocatellia bacterium]
MPQELVGYPPPQAHLPSSNKPHATAKNVFKQLMVAVKYNSEGQISQALYDVGGEYRRNM